MIGPQESTALLIGNWELLVTRLRGTILRGSGVTSLFANVPLAFFNVSALDTPTPTSADFRRALTLVKERAAACPHPSLVAISQGWIPANWLDLAAEVGFSPAVHLTAMDATEVLPPTRPLPDLAFHRATTAAVATDLALINAHAYGLPVEQFDCMFNLNLWNSDTIGVTGSIAGQAVTAAAIFPVAGTAYAAFVATLPAHQGKGYAEAALRHAIAHADTKRITMHATELGSPIYLRMGFTPGEKTVLLSRIRP